MFHVYFDIVINGAGLSESVTSVALPNYPLSRNAIIMATFIFMNV